MADEALGADAVDARVRGTLRYAIDLSIPGMAHAALVRSPVAAARIRSISTIRAASMPGVSNVVTAADLDGLHLADQRFGTVVADQPILARDRVRHIGEPIAMVVATTPAEAWAAADAVELDLLATLAVEDVDAALAAGAPLVHDDRPGNILGRANFTNGDLAAAERATVHRSSGWYTSPAAQQVTLEPQVCIARWTDTGLEMWAATQSPSRIAAELARVFGLELDQVRLHVPPLGGGYGGKNHAKLEPLVAAVAAIAGRPVRLVNRRVEEFVTTTKHGARIWLESGVDADARFTFRRARIVMDGGAYAHSSPAVMRAGMLVVCGPYRVPAAEVESVMVYTNLPPAGSFRGLGANQAAWAGERQVDELAREIGLDPVELRRRNVVRSGDRLPTGERVAGAHWAACLDAATASLDSAQGPIPDLGPGRRSGIGVALAMKHTMTPSRSEAVVAALVDGTVEVRSSLVDMGQGLPGVLAQAAIRHLGLTQARIRVIEPDTARTPFDATTSSSRGTWSGTTAVERAALALRDRLETAAAARFGVPREAVALGADWVVRVVDVEEGLEAPSLPVVDLVIASGDGEISGHGIAINEAPVDPETGTTASSSHWHQGAVAVRVSVDPETGVTRVLEAHGAAWAGRVVNARGARLQNEGNILTGLGPTLFESLELATGGWAPRDLLDYRIPSILDLPDRLETVALEAGPNEPDKEPTGLGESLIPAVAPAVAAAIADAVGVDLRDLPLDPTRVLAAILDDPTLERSRDSEGRSWAVPGTAPGRNLVRLTLTVDGQPADVLVDPGWSLATVLRESLGHQAIRQPCGVGTCGACTAVVDGDAIRTCLRPAGLTQNATIVTAAGLADDDPFRQAFVNAGAAQCGFCIPGMVLVARSAFEREPDIDADGIRRALTGNLCRCGTYARVLAAVEAAVASGRR